MFPQPEAASIHDVAIDVKFRLEVAECRLSALGLAARRAEAAEWLPLAEIGKRLGQGWKTYYSVQFAEPISLGRAGRVADEVTAEIDRLASLLARFVPGGRA